MKTYSTVAAMALVTLFCLEPGFTQQRNSEELNALTQDIQRLKQGQATIQKELSEIKILLQKELHAAKERPAPALPPAAARAQAPMPAQPSNIVLSIDGAPFKGDKNAKVTIVEFTDYQCPFCARHHRETIPEVERDYIKTGKVKYVVRHLPLDSIHPLAFNAAEASSCAADQGKFWEMHGRLMVNQRALSPKDLLVHAEAAGLDLPTFQRCLDNGKHASSIRKDQADAHKAGITGTPGIFLGLTEPNDPTVKVLEVIKGAQHYSGFRLAIERALSAQKK